MTSSDKFLAVVVIVFGVVMCVAFWTGYAKAASKGASGLQIVDRLYDGFDVVKVYDSDTNVVCYIRDGTYSGGISCLKNN